MRPATHPAPPTAWPVLSVVIGAVGLALGALPHHIGLIGVAAGGFGVAAGTIGILLRGRRRAAMPVSGISVSALAVIVAIVAPYVQADHGNRADNLTDETGNTATVLGKQVDVQFGTFSYTPRVTGPAVRSTSLEGAKLMVTLTNRLRVPRRFYLTVAGFERPGVQLEAFTVDATLDAGATRAVNAAERMALSEKQAHRLTTATFTVLAAHSSPAGRP